VRALRAANIDFHPGEIHSIVGENGAGKSTLVRLLAGIETPDEGAILIDGEPVQFRNPAASHRAGISIVPQDAGLVPNLSIGRNVLLGRESLWSSRNRLTPKERATVVDALQRMGAGGRSPEEPASTLSVAELRLCQIAATLIDPGRLLILDEPTAVLSDADAELLLDRLEHLRETGTSILYISHRLGEVLQLSDRITILRDGAVVGTYLRGELDRDAMLDLMARKQDTEPSVDAATTRSAPPAAAGSDDQVVLSVRELSRAGAFADVGFDVHAGEVVGIAGIQGSGHGRLLEAIAGSAPADSGAVFVDGRSVDIGSLHAALRAGIRLVPEERRERGIVGPRSIRENLAIGYGSNGQRHVLRKPSREHAVADAWIHRFGIRAASSEVATATLSGGNQQKVVIARAVESTPRVLLLCEPTQGIDVRAKSEILAILRRIARQQNIAVVLASAEFEELLEFTDVIHVMRLGKMAATVRTKDASYSEVLAAAVP
jgi:ABC-type sugar transport system ATPase subunit